MGTDERLHVPGSFPLLILGMGDLQPLMTGILIMGPYKPLRNKVDDHPILYGNNGSLDPGTHCYQAYKINTVDGSEIRRENPPGMVLKPVVNI